MAPGYYQQYATAYSNQQAAAAGMYKKKNYAIQCHRLYNFLTILTNQLYQARLNLTTHYRYYYLGHL